mmetsp:Transcript_23611/g.49188  ORF Transcript_23611/g.49188 Transcript_23611/m.49188 type:complete len:275 (+) Transcript_23611:507-1331(+)
MRSRTSCIHSRSAHMALFVAAVEQIIEFPEVRCFFYDGVLNHHDLISIYFNLKLGRLFILFVIKPEIEVDQLVIVQFDEVRTDLHFCDASLMHVIYFGKKLLHRTRRYPLVDLAFYIACHRPRLAAARLTVSEQTNVVPVDSRINQVTRVLVYFLLRLARAEDAIITILLEAARPFNFERRVVHKLHALLGHLVFLQFVERSASRVHPDLSLHILNLVPVLLAQGLLVAVIFPKLVNNLLILRNLPSEIFHFRSNNLNLFQLLHDVLQITALLL